MNRTTRTRAVAVAAATVAALIVWFVVTPILGIDLVVPAGTGAEMQLGPGPVMVIALGSGLLGWVAAILLEGRAGRPRRTWTVLALSVLVLSLVPVFTIGADVAATISLAILHLVVAGVLVPRIASTLTTDRSPIGPAVR